MKSHQPIKLLLAEDHLIVAEGLRGILEDEFHLLATVGDGRALIDAAKSLGPDVIIADISMPLLNGLDALRQLRREGVEAKVIFLTMHAEVALAREAFRAGAAGYLLKQSAGKELIAAVREVAAGGRHVTPLITTDPINFFLDAASAPVADHAPITPRQREVLQLFAEGRTMKEAAAILNISARTIESHKYDMMAALGARNNAELLQHAVRLGLVSIDARPRGA